MKKDITLICYPLVSFQYDGRHQDDELRAYHPYRVFNLGRQWYTTLHTLINYEVNLRPYKPEVIINDYGHFSGPVNRIITESNFVISVWQIVRHFWYFNSRQIIEQKVFPGIISFERNLNTLIDLAEKDRKKRCSPC